MKLKYFCKSQDAVAEVLDFVSIIGILLLSFGIIGVAGYPILTNAQETRYTENTRLSFVVLAGNLNKVALGQAPSQSAELKMYGGRLSVTRDSRINITAKNSTGQIITLADKQLGNIQSSIGGTVVAYEGTGVWINYPSGVTLNVYKPLITNQSNVLIIPVVTISGNSSVGGNGLSRIRADGAPSVTTYNNVSNVTITITGNYISGWKDYFNNTMKWNVQMSSTNVTANLNTITKSDVYILNTQMYTEIE